MGHVLVICKKSNHLSNLVSSWGLIETNLEIKGSITKIFSLGIDLVNIEKFKGYTCKYPS